MPQSSLYGSSMDALLPALRRLTQPVSARRMAAQRPEFGPVTQPCGPWTEMLLVEDREDRVRFVQQRDLAETPRETRWQQAFANLAARAHEPIALRDGVVEVTDWGGFASSLVALQSWRRTVGEAVGTDPVFLAPDVDHLRVVDGNAPDIEHHLAWAFSTFRETARPLSPAPLFRPERAPRNFALLKAFAYAEQDEVLLEMAPDGVYVAETVLALSGSDATLSTRVEPGYPCWLPEVDEVELPSGRVPMASLGLRRVEGVEPPRWLWPS